MNLHTLDPWIHTLVAAAVAVVLGLIIHRVGRFVVLRVTSFSVVLSTMARAIDRPAQFVLPLIALQVVWHAASEELALVSGVRHVNAVLLIAALTWLGLRAVRGVADGFIKLHPADVEDNLQARRIQTQARVLARTTQFVVLLLGLGLMLMTFPGARQVGTSILASAGVVGLVAGIAAKSVFGNLIAGLQIALSQPIRIDDVLIVKGEWGRVEEITGTYVVLRIWDQRRLIIPLQWFIDNPFENWTRSSAELLGTVFLWVDYALPLEPLRREALRICESSPDWDGRLCKIQVTDANERAMQVRVLVSAASSGQAWELRCLVRERLIDFIQREYPHALPRLRAEVDERPGAPASGPMLTA